MSTMLKLTIIVIIIAILLIQDSQAKRKTPGCLTKCVSGVIGDPCPYFQCKPGYTCAKIKGEKLCCRDPVCPPGWLEGFSCNFNSNEICPEGFECKANNFCCRSTFCPSGSIGRKCLHSRECDPGYTCRGGNCCKDPLCQKGWKEGGICNLTPEGPICKHGFECNNDYCCKRPAYCPSGVIGPSCKDLPCKIGYTCKKGFCCRD